MISDAAKMHGIQEYLKKQDKTSSFIETLPDSDLKLVVVIPAFKEENIAITIDSLYACEAVDFPVEIIVFVNGCSTDIDEVRGVNLKCIHHLEMLQERYENHQIKLQIFSNLKMSSKLGGVGRARKMLMDEASYRFAQVAEPNGVIVNLDADCVVSPNYFQEIKFFFEQNSKFNACSIHFEHLFGFSKSEMAGVDYELHLRYFIGMQKKIGLPFAFQTIGSAMACNVSAYAKLGGMNKRKAGEDFYFLHKFIKNNDCGELSSTTVFPADRVSDRVPFGTGKAIADTLKGKRFTTYNPASFDVLAKLIDNLEILYGGKFDITSYGLDKQLVAFLQTIDFEAKVREIIKHTTNLKSFQKRFYQYFDAFQLMKYLHFVRDSAYENVTIEVATRNYFEQIGLAYNLDRFENLKTLRKFDKRVVLL